MLKLFYYKLVLKKYKIYINSFIEIFNVFILFHNLNIITWFSEFF